MRRVLAVTAIRSEYFLSKPIFQAILDHPDLDLDLIVSGTHLSPMHDYSVNIIEQDGFVIRDKIESLINSDRDAGRLKGAAGQLQVLAHLVDKYRPDWLLAVGDREEPMILSLCGMYLNIPVAHYAAGDRVVGNVDDMVRHAVSRLSHILLCTNEDARQRLIRSGEEEWRVHTVGHSGLDRFRTTEILDKSALAKLLQIDSVDDNYMVIIQHPLSSEIDQAGDQMRESMEAAKLLGIQTFVSYPNSDAGSGQIIEVIQQYADAPNFHVFRNFPDVPFVNLLRGARVLLGNSSLGIMEAPYLKLPVINVGRRQAQRHHAENIFFIPHDRNKIADQVRAIMQNEDIIASVQNASNPFGDGHSGVKVADLLANTEINENLLNKDLTF